MYSNESMLTYEAEQYLGAQQIMSKLNTLPTLKHTIKTFDAQPTTNNGIVAFVTGELSIDGGQPLAFT